MESKKLPDRAVMAIIATLERAGRELTALRERPDSVVKERISTVKDTR